MGIELAQTRPGKGAQAAAQASTPAILAWEIGLILITLAVAKNKMNPGRRRNTL